MSALSPGDTKKLVSVLRANGDTQHDRKNRRFVEGLQLDPPQRYQPAHVFVARRRDIKLAGPNDERSSDLGDRHAGAGEPLEILDQSYVEPRGRSGHARTALRAGGVARSRNSANRAL